MRKVYTFAGLTFAWALAFSLTTAQTSGTESKQQASPDQNQTGSAGNGYRDRVGERLEWLSQHLNLTEDQKKQLKPILAGEFKQMRAVGGGSADNHHGHNSGQWRQIEVRNDQRARNVDNPESLNGHGVHYVYAKANVYPDKDSIHII